jgi:hypothetical protein
MGLWFPPVRGEEVDDDCYLTTEQALGPLSVRTPFASKWAAKENYSTFFGPFRMPAVENALETGKSLALSSVLMGSVTSSVNMGLSTKPYANTEAGARLREKSEEARQYIESLKKNWAEMSD